MSGKLTHLSTFSGIGGLDLAAEWAGFETVGQCEWADYPTKILEKHWPDVPRWRDIRTLTKESFYEKTGLRTVDLISGGFPCQPFSFTGKRGGKDDDRYLWPELLRVISEIRPRWVVGENVAGIVNLALDTVLSDLESIGYTCEAIVIPACAVDAPHRRDRVAILGYSGGGGLHRGRGRKHGTEPQDGLRGSAEPGVHGVGNGIREDVYRDAVADTASIGLQGRGIRQVLVSEREREREKISQSALRVDRGYSVWDKWPDEPDVPRVGHGIPNRVDRIKCLGNAVVPQQFYPIFKAIADIERGENSMERREVEG